MLRQSVGMTVLLGVLLFWMPAPGEINTVVEEKAPMVEEVETKPPAVDEQKNLSVEVGGKLVELRLSEYLVGVVAAEMPASFEMEALKAQTVAARTYTLYQMAHGSTGKHESGSYLCDDPGCCQAYLTEERLRENWGDAAEKNLQKFRIAEAETDGMAILYGGEPILAAFHSSSAEGTEDAAAAWSSSVPYLQRVESPEKEEQVPNYRVTVSFSADEFRQRFLEAYPAGKLSGSCGEWVKNAVRDESGYVSSIQVGDQLLRGVELRRLLGLRSACFDVTAEAERLTFTTRGYGHGVGMSQYGANTLAAEGKTWQEILRWYYTGVNIEVYAT